MQSHNIALKSFTSVNKQDSAQTSGVSGDETMSCVWESELSQFLLSITIPIKAPRKEGLAAPEPQPSRLGSASILHNLGSCTRTPVPLDWVGPVPFSQSILVYLVDLANPTHH